MWYCKYRKVKTDLKWYNPLSWVIRGWEELTTSSPPEGHSIITACQICFYMLFYWLYYILFIGWFNRLFRPTMWIGTREQVKEGFIDNNFDRKTCLIAEEAIRCNENGAIIKIVQRDNWLYPDRKSVRVSSPGYNYYYPG